MLFAEWLFCNGLGFFRRTFFNILTSFVWCFLSRVVCLLFTDVGRYLILFLETFLLTHVLFRVLLLKSNDSNTFMDPDKKFHCLSQDDISNKGAALLKTVQVWSYKDDEMHLTIVTYSKNSMYEFANVNLKRAYVKTIIVMNVEIKKCWLWFQLVCMLPADLGWGDHFSCDIGGVRRIACGVRNQSYMWRSSRTLFSKL